MYTSRIVGVGDFKGNPLVSFTLASRSIPYRKLVSNAGKRKINVFPRDEKKDHSTNQDPEVDNYACIMGRHMQLIDSVPLEIQDANGSIAQEYFSMIVPFLKYHFLVASNGHMCKRCMDNLVNGMPLNIAIDSTLHEFRGASNDARIIAAAKRKYDGSVSYCLGINDKDRGEKRVLSYPNQRVNNLTNRLVYVYDRNTDFENIFDLNDAPPIGSLDDLAKYIHQNIIGEEISFGVATGIGILENKEFRFGVYNREFTAEDLDRWRAELKIIQ